MICEHFINLRRIPRYRAALVVLCIEANYGGSVGVSRIADLIRSVDYKQTGNANQIWVRSRSNNEDGLEGIWTTDTLKACYTRSLINVMSSGNLFVCETRSFVTCKRNKHTRDADPDHILNELYKQLGNYRYETTYADDKPMQIAKTAITGKSPGCKDDLAFALSMSLHWNSMTRRERSFQALARSTGMNIT